MVGIRSYGAHIPKYRLGKETAGWTYPGEADIGITDNPGGRVRAPQLAPPGYDAASE